jgi:hypothetical protein
MANKSSSTPGKNPARPEKAGGHASGGNPSDRSKTADTGKAKMPDTDKKGGSHGGGHN